MTSRIKMDLKISVLTVLCVLPVIIGGIVLFKGQYIITILLFVLSFWVITITNRYKQTRDEMQELYLFEEEVDEEMRRKENEE